MNQYEMGRMSDREIVDHFGWLSQGEGAIDDIISGIMVAFERIGKLRAELEEIRARAAAPAPAAGAGPAAEFDLPGLSGRYGRSALLALRAEVADRPPGAARDRLTAALDDAIRGIERAPLTKIDAVEVVFAGGTWIIEERKGGD